MSEVFSGRVEDYINFRSDYTSKLKDFLIGDFALKKDHRVADVGSGTGLLSKWFLDLGNEVYGIEPNVEMRRECAERFKKLKRFTTVAGSAEHTSLQDNSVDVVAAGNAFHWFQPVATRREFRRILREGGRVLLIRTHWIQFPSSLMQEYTKLVDTFCQGRSGAVANQDLEDKALNEFFHPGTFTKKSLGESITPMTLEHLKGRFLSTSFAPRQGHEKHTEAMDALEQLFNRHQENGSVAFGVITNLAYGELQQRE